MKSSRRLNRMERRQKRKMPGLNLVSLMDVFTILVFFLLVNSSTSEVLDTPKQITLPESVIEAKPRESVVVMVTPEAILVQGEPVVSYQNAMQSKSATIGVVRDQLKKAKANMIGIKNNPQVNASEVTILAHKTIPFRLLKKVMASCTSAGYEKISLAVIQKAAKS
ncbi:MAG: biopolymer transporter ExbD [Pseudomonadota bacterium]|nr:biopolymer transporter ExbD [Pseudomonadota bacterium]